MRRLILAGGVTALVLASGLAVAGAGGAAATRGVEIEDIDFKPGRVVVRKGATVRWTFADGSTAHNVVSRGAKRFKSSPVKSQGTYSVRFRRKGTYRYVCTLHPGMAGRVVVR